MISQPVSITFFLIASHLLGEFIPLIFQFRTFHCLFCWLPMWILWRWRKEIVLNTIWNHKHLDNQHFMYHALSIPSLDAKINPRQVLDRTSYQRCNIVPNLHVNVRIRPQVLDRTSFKIGNIHIYISTRSIKQGPSLIISYKNWKMHIKDRPLQHMLPK